MARKRRQRSTRSQEPRHISEVVAEILARSGVGETQSARELQAAWQETVGPPLDELSRVVRLSRGKLEVVVSHSAAVQELTFRKHEILRRLQQRWPQKAIRDIRFRVGPVE
ncbi:DUF721 domain-containing protein [Thermogutta sp.]|uniref:DUF721 domain-containing protein n=1 Tax=Thermogutta sp. TaxID=1962930 RepID=UPI0032201C6D